MGCSYTAICHTCSVQINLGYTSYKSWYIDYECACNRNLHAFLVEHAGHKYCIINNDWWCSHIDKHIKGIEQKLDWSERDDWEASLEEVKIFLGSDYPSRTCGGYKCRCYYG